MLSSVTIPDEDMATVRTTHYKVSTPEIGFFYLRVKKKEMTREFKSKLLKKIYSILKLQQLIGLENKKLKRAFVF